MIILMKLAKFSLFYRFAILTIFTLFIFSCDEQNGKYSYKTIENAPIDIKIHTLKNGLKLYLIPTKNEPRIQTRIVVKAGSK